ncbi:hypothetical protein BDV95DRAFT_152551 [Massariosphaeria phaeospora]|uniref:Nuclear rim protein 1 n=1 Tax=Massariosphaeria phaeospora TaxID=100035 RepID=A0A7C8MIC7_9PLEO|nr:hypothetical protein BDV95DRAFT_152551 [Massariosphaeria phaeospora]
MPRLVRKAPLAERVKAYLDPLDWLMWASEELSSHDWDEFAHNYAVSLGFGMNVVFILAKANAGQTRNKAVDDVFADIKSGAGWLQWFTGLVVLVLTALSFLNGFYTFYQKRRYRLFEQPIDTSPSTPSAHRVRVDSSPMGGASPLRFLQNIISSSSAESRAHPDAARHVWEIAVWDPNPLCLQIFCLFSPLHVVLYIFNLPVAPLDPQPSVKVVVTIAIAAMLSFHLYFLRSAFTQQAKDSAIIQREVFHEYDAKFVHPMVQRPSRDVAIQTISRKRTRDSAVGVSGSSDDLASEVVTYTPTTVINKGFRTNPNNIFASQYDPDNLASQPKPRAIGSSAHTPSFRSGFQNSQYSSATTATGADFSSPIRQSNTPNPFRQLPSQLRPSGDGGSLGVYSHAASPLRKSSSANYLREDRGRDSTGGGDERSTPGGLAGGARPLTPADRLGRGYGGLGVGRRESGRF